MKTCFSRLVECVFFCVLLLAPSQLRAVPQNPDWNVAALDQILAGVQPSQTLVTVGDMRILVTKLTAWRNQLAGVASPQSAFDGVAATWPGGNVYYTFSNNVTSLHQRAFLDAAGEWAMFANLHFIARTTQSNYVTIQENTGLEGGQSDEGMVGGQQFLSISPDSFNRGTICHEIGHTLGLVHEHQRSDRDSFVTIMTNNITNGAIGNFVLLSDSRNQGAYDFLSVMHYARNYLAIATNLDTIVPLPAYTQFINLMGVPGPITLSAGDRAGMAAVYGPGPTITSVVTNTADSGPGTLRAALYFAYDHPGTRITFNISTNAPGYTNGVFTIQPSDQLPSLVNATTIEGASQPTNANSNPNGHLIQINGALAPVPPFPNGLRFAGTNCYAHGLVINGFTSSSVLFDTTNATHNTIGGCYLGIDPSGTIAVTNGLSPVTLQNGANANLVGGTSATNRNIISGSANQGVFISDPATQNNSIQGNYIGLNAAGTAALPNGLSGVGLVNGATGNIIGGTAPGTGNIISGNSLQGVAIRDPGTTRNLIQGNFIGLNPAGTAAIPNVTEGVNIFLGAQSNVIGGTEPGAGNVISGNLIQGISFQNDGTTGNIIQGNIIGLNAAGSAAIPNLQSGIEIFDDAGSSIIGGGNVISGNTGDGVLFDHGACSNLIQGNLVGLDLTGHTAIPNTGTGVEMFIGTTANIVGSGNVISGNGIDGVALDNGASSNTVRGNFIGLDVTGTTAVPNAAQGVEMFLGANANFIGGIGGRNYISGNSQTGVQIEDDSFGDIVQGNTIGLNISNAAVPNLEAGIGLFGDAQSNILGGVLPGEANLIANNGGGGVELYDTNTIDNAIRGNSIYGNNSGLGIYLYLANNSGSEGTPNIVSAITTTITTVTGNLISLPNTTFHFDFYANPPNAAQGETYIGTRDSQTDSSGTTSFTAQFAAPIPAGHIITVSATDPAGNTSQLSDGAIVSATDSVGDGIPDAWRAAHFIGDGTTTNAQSCATCDPDHDGLNNRQEFLAGTDPNNAASKLLIGSVAANGADLTVNFSSVSGITYRIESKNDLTAAWSLFADQILGTGATIQLTDPGAASFPSRYYRLDVLP